MPAPARTAVLPVALTGGEDGELDAETFNVSGSAVRAPDMSTVFTCSTDGSGCDHS